MQFLRSQKENGCRVTNIAVMSASWQPSEIEAVETLGGKILHKPVKLGELVAWLSYCESNSGNSTGLSSLPLT